MSQPRITFGIIVLNGEPFLKYNLKALYPYAHQIIVAEGASPGARNIATSQGHSRDGTMETLRQFKRNEDPEDKIIIVTAEDEGHPDGFWPGEKDEQSKAYAKRATGDYLWQVDVDEFYRNHDIEKVITLLTEKPDITAVAFEQITFWGGADYITDGWFFDRADLRHIRRIFKWGPGYTYATHRPPTVINDQGQDVYSLNVVTGRQSSVAEIYMHHYSLLFPKQVIEKCDYYKNANWSQRLEATDWAEQVFMNLQRPFRVHNVYRFPSWLERFTGQHPEQISAMINDIEAGRIKVDVRRNDDIEKLLNSYWYPVARKLVKRLDPIEKQTRKILAKFAIRRLLRAPASIIRRIRRRILK